MAEPARSPAAGSPVVRPLSPHLQIYRWTWTMAMSVFHRITGVALYAGTFLVAVWLVALASGPGAYDPVAWLYGSILGRLVIFVYTWILLHHMLGGIRHLVWDFGHGMEPGTRIAMAKYTLVGSAALTVVVWAVALLAR
ncbi:succinate dehydrogenase, cytochrome b556 subunit [Methylobacterium oryzihabitans]|uniref:Succinate dehydrogenase cytochrome b556 subunit n=1 Tax=Methylobacterium oryzihabitans TaxID=2499852 RepID=A0A437NWW8_9HYPH|nr:succinate dehydrogenase, cytochrome b556 subunit [Methylobacterium oryzihabitans]RVU14495.1 succinate dehydrogenase, cytochrome b556 subunit [Methylobacterium oryzihabitans]